MAETAVPQSEPEAEPVEEPAREEEAGAPRRTRFVESILDNLPAWAFVALAISALYLVWATLVILEKYVGELPGVAP